MKKQFLLFTAVTSILGIQLAHADVLPPDQKPIPVCSYIQGMENFPKLTFLVEETSVSSSTVSTKTVQKNDCISASYKFNTVKLFAVNTDYFKTIQINGYVPSKDPYAYPSDEVLKITSKLVPLNDKTEYEHYYFGIDGIDNTNKLLKTSFISMNTNLMVADAFPKPVTGLDSEITMPQIDISVDTPVKPPVINKTLPFKDISQDNPYRLAISYLKEKSIVNGYPDGTFRPYNKITRAEFTKIVMEAGYNLKTIEQPTTPPVYDQFEAPFKDVPLVKNATAWYADYVNWAATISLIQGYPDGTFRPNQDINFVEAAKIIINTFQLHGDGEPNAPWYKIYVNVLAYQKAIPVTITHFDQKITRGEMAEMIYRLMTGNKNLPSQTYTDLN